MSTVVNRLHQCPIEPCPGELGALHDGVTTCQLCHEVAVACDRDGCAGMSADVARFCRECGQPLDGSAVITLDAATLERLRAPVDAVRTGERFAVAPTRCGARLLGVSRSGGLLGYSPWQRGVLAPVLVGRDLADLPPAVLDVGRQRVPHLVSMGANELVGFNLYERGFARVSLYSARVGEVLGGRLRRATGVVTRNDSLFFLKQGERGVLLMRTGPAAGDEQEIVLPGAGAGEGCMGPISIGDGIAVVGEERLWVLQSDGVTAHALPRDVRPVSRPTSDLAPGYGQRFYVTGTTGTYVPASRGDALGLLLLGSGGAADFIELPRPCCYGLDAANRVIVSCPHMIGELDGRAVRPIVTDPAIEGGRAAFRAGPLVAGFVRAGVAGQHVAFWVDGQRIEAALRADEKMACMGWSLFRGILTMSFLESLEDGDCLAFSSWSLS